MYPVVLFLIGLVFMPVSAQELKVATFNVSMEASNYAAPGSTLIGEELFQQLATGDNQQIKNIAEVIQRSRPDILLLNEFDYQPDPSRGYQAFQQRYLSQSQNGAKPIVYPYAYTAPVNTGLATGLDLDKDGIKSDKGADAQGFGFFEGQYGMLLLSRYPIQQQGIRTFQKFLWKDMPGNLMQTIVDEQGKPWFDKAATDIQRLSSKSHWQIPVNVDGKLLYLLISHPTPPAFDGPEQRNVKRNHDEIRFWQDFLSPGKANYIYDDQGKTGGFEGQRFILMGDLNASADEGNGLRQGIGGLLDHKRVNSEFIPVSKGGAEHTANNKFAAGHTASWGMRADYVLPSYSGIKVKDGGVFWPQTEDELYYLVQDRQSSSDHRMVWLTLDVFE